MTLVVIYLTYGERKVVARFQQRLGPTRTGPAGLLQGVADALKLVAKEDVRPRNADRWVSEFAPFMTFIPVFVILMGQVVLTIALCWFVIFQLMGRDHEAAVMSGGYCGFMLGTTANSLACMNEIVRKSGPAPRAFFVVSIVGAFLIDFINAILINTSINVLRP